MRETEEEVERERERERDDEEKKLTSPKQKKKQKTLEQEYVAHPYNADVELGEEVRAMFAPVPADTVLPSQIPEGYNFRKYDRKTKKNWGGIAAVSFYCLALVLYFFVRVTKTMDLGRYMFYGVVVFFIEVRVFFFLLFLLSSVDVVVLLASRLTTPISLFSLSLSIHPPNSNKQQQKKQMCGATTTLIYGANLVLDPVSEEPVKDESSDVPGMVKVAVPYHVRVMVPCYSEPLDIISKTCEAAQRAALPAGCRVS